MNMAPARMQCAGMRRPIKTSPLLTEITRAEMWHRRQDHRRSGASGDTIAAAPYAEITDNDEAVSRSEMSTIRRNVWGAVSAVEAPVTEK